MGSVILTYRFDYSRFHSVLHLFLWRFYAVNPAFFSVPIFLDFPRLLDYNIARKKHIISVGEVTTGIGLFIPKIAAAGPWRHG